MTAQNRTFSTIKRVYLDADDNLVREENVEDQNAAAGDAELGRRAHVARGVRPAVSCRPAEGGGRGAKLADSMQPGLEAAAPAAPRRPRRPRKGRAAREAGDGPARPRGADRNRHGDGAGLACR
ncbi:hypothetical protein [Thauera humireducens]|uniref:hypothetical protein n=1 Tax=Thauera humireducens TaxID=1134435 RepID=UPI00311DF2E8